MHLADAQLDLTTKKLVGTKAKNLLEKMQIHSKSLAHRNSSRTNLHHKHYLDFFSDEQSFSNFYRQIFLCLNFHLFFCVALLNFRFMLYGLSHALHVKHPCMHINVCFHKLYNNNITMIITMNNNNKYHKLMIHNLLDCDDDFRSTCRNVGQCHQQQSFSGLLSPGRSNHTNDRVQTIFRNNN